MAQITVTVGGKPYRMACADGEEAHLEGLAQQVDARVNELRASFGEIGDQRLTVMAAISIADDLAESVRKITRLGADMEDLVHARRAATGAGDTMAEAMAARLEAVAARIERLTQAMNGAGVGN